MRNGILTITAALKFAAERHTGQTRKGERAEPYVNHLADVAELVAIATDGDDAGLVAAALLHDVVEDTPTSITEVEERFGVDVAALVAEVTDDKSLPREERKRLQVERAASKTPRAKMLKLADKTANLHALAESPPRDWPLERKTEYVAWARHVVAGLRGVNKSLEEEFDRAARKAQIALTSP